MEDIAQLYVEVSCEENIDYYEYYKSKFISEKVSNANLRDRLILFRKKRSIEMKLPAYYIFTNDELDKIVELKPKTVNELKNDDILSSIKIKTHGETIINEINK